MKPFFKGFGTGCLVSLGAIMVMPMMMMVALLGSDKPSVEDESVLEIDLSGALSELPEANGGLTSLSFSLEEKPTLFQLTDAIAKASHDKRICGIYLKAGDLSADYASLQELRRSLLDFKNEGKWVVAYGDTYSQGAYYVCSAADSLYINPSGMIDWHGIASRPIFLKGLLEKVGVEIQVCKVGRYKSAPEMFCATELSEDSRAQTEAFIGSIWGTVVGDVAHSTGVPADSLRLWAGQMMFASNTADDYVAKHLATATCYEDEVPERLRRLMDLGVDDELPRTTLKAMMPSDRELVTSGERLVVYSAVGDIVDGDGSGSQNVIAGDVVCRDLDALAKEDKVKAVVVRVNSGGGSAYASEQIWNSMKRLAAKKTLVVSMGGMAASGGYYMSCGAPTIFAERTTLTGSIGIFGTIPNAKRLLDETLGVGFATVQTNPHAAGITLTSPLDEEELACMQKYVERGYDLFLSRVAEGRGLTTDSVHTIAQGRVWTGADAIEIGLVDQIGGLYDAVAYAAEQAGLDANPDIQYLPKSMNLLETLLAGEEVKPVLPETSVPSALKESWQLLQNIDRWQGVQARMPFIMEIK